MSKQKFASEGRKKPTGCAKGKQKSSFFSEEIQLGKEAYEKEKHARQQSDNTSPRTGR